MFNSNVIDESPIGPTPLFVDKLAGKKNYGDNLLPGEGKIFIITNIIYLLKVIKLLIIFKLVNVFLEEERLVLLVNKLNNLNNGDTL